jgi:uncharacterized protein YbcC (UPF0753/DUF2309 family)
MYTPPFAGILGLPLIFESKGEKQSSRSCPTLSNPSNPSLFHPVLELAKSEKVTDEMFGPLRIADAVRQYVGDAYRAGSVPEEVFNFVLASHEDATRPIQDRIHRLRTVFRRP